MCARSLLSLLQFYQDTIAVLGVKEHHWLAMCSNLEGEEMKKVEGVDGIGKITRTQGLHFTIPSSI